MTICITHVQLRSMPIKAFIYFCNNFQRLGLEFLWEDDPPNTSDSATTVRTDSTIQEIVHINEDAIPKPSQIDDSTGNNEVVEELQHDVEITPQIDQEYFEGVDDEQCNQDLIERSSHIEESTGHFESVELPHHDVEITPQMDEDDFKKDEKADCNVDFIKVHRYQARYHKKKGLEYIAKASRAIEDANAENYKDLATFHTNINNLCNNMAIAIILEIGSRNNDNVLDLHHLYVVEAVAVLDLFLDQNIAEVREVSLTYRTVSIITGRGLHSPQNKPRIKPAVMKRLADRGLSMEEANPGMLRCRLLATDKLTTDIYVR